MNRLKYHALVKATHARYRPRPRETCEERRRRLECDEFDRKIEKLGRLRKAGRCRQ